MINALQVCNLRMVCICKGERERRVSPIHVTVISNSLTIYNHCKNKSSKILYYHVTI